MMAKSILNLAIKTTTRRTALALAIISILLMTPALFSGIQLVEAQQAGSVIPNFIYYADSQQFLYQIGLPSDWQQPMQYTDPSGFVYVQSTNPGGNEGILLTFFQSPAQVGSSTEQLVDGNTNGLINAGYTMEPRREGSWNVYPAQMVTGQTPPDAEGNVLQVEYVFIEANGIVYALLVKAPNIMDQNIQNIALSFQPLTPQSQGPSQSLPPDIQTQINLMKWQQAFQNQHDSFVVMSNILSSITP